MVAKIKTRQNLSRRHKHKPKGISDRTFEKIHWPYIPVLMVLLIFLSVSLQSGMLSAAAKNPVGKVLAYASSMSVNGLLTSTNSARSDNSVAALQLNDKLNAAAQAKAEDMAAKNYWSHYTPEGNPPWVFVTNQGYGYLKLGENLAAGFASEQATVNGWMASEPHRVNMLDSAFSEVGFGFANNPNYTSAGGGPMTIVVAFYGKPTTPVAPIAAPAPPPAPPARSSTPAKVTPPAPAPQPPAPAPEPVPPPPVAPTAQVKPKPSQPATTDTPRSGITLSVRTSRASVAFAKAPLSSFATGMASFVAIAAAGFWLSRHVLFLKRALMAGKAYAIRHPLLDVALLATAALAFLLTRPAGLIQ